MCNLEIKPVCFLLYENIKTVMQEMQLCYKCANSCVFRLQDIAMLLPGYLNIFQLYLNSANKK
jgi:hypothetical protein